jgi:hypothetical protein
VPCLREMAGECSATHMPIMETITKQVPTAIEAENGSPKIIVPSRTATRSTAGHLID